MVTPIVVVGPWLMTGSARSGPIRWSDGGGKKGVPWWPLCPTG